MVAHTFDPSTQGTETSILYEFEADLVYSEFQASQEYTVRPCLNKKTLILFLLTNSETV